MRLVKAVIRRLEGLYFKARGVKMGKNSSVHRSVDVHCPKNVSIGSDSVIYKQVSIYSSRKGSFEMGNHSHIAPFGYLLIDFNRLSIGHHVAVGPFCVMICHSNSIHGDHAHFTDNYEDGDISIGNNVFIGAHCTILPGAVIEDNVAVAAHSLVKGRLQSGGVYGGVPARNIKALKQK